jgi:uridine kinase|tara:strand:- start:172 stop:696 length:525 start_codon:yes stop_codon:yes gene_type:complete
MHSKLITITSYAGGGKTEVTKALAKQLNSTSVYHFDEIDEKVVFPKNFPNAEANEYNLDQIFQIIKKDKLNSTGFIIFDYPFGKYHSKMNSLIDFAIYIDVPLDIAMCRRLLRDLDVDRLELLPQLIGELKYYELKGRDAYLYMLKNIKPTCDLVVDGTRSIDKIITKIKEKIV